MAQKKSAQSTEGRFGISLAWYHLPRNFTLVAFNGTRSLWRIRRPTRTSCFPSLEKLNHHVEGLGNGRKTWMVLECLTMALFFLSVVEERWGSGFWTVGSGKILASWIWMAFVRHIERLNLDETEVIFSSNSVCRAGHCHGIHFSSSWGLCRNSSCSGYFCSNTGHKSCRNRASFLVRCTLCSRGGLQALNFMSWLCGRYLFVEGWSVFFFARSCSSSDLLPIWPVSLPDPCYTVLAQYSDREFAEFTSLVHVLQEDSFWIWMRVALLLLTKTAYLLLCPPSFGTCFVAWGVFVQPRPSLFSSPAFATFDVRFNREVVSRTPFFHWVCLTYFDAELSLDDQFFLDATSVDAFL